MTVVYPPAMLDIRYWLRRHPDISPYTNGRTFFRIPENAQFPLQRIYRSGGGRQQGRDAPVQDVLVSIECWSNLDGGYQALSQMVTATQSAVDDLPSRSLINPTSTTLVVDAQVTNLIDSPDPDTGWPRFIVDSRFTVISA